LTRYRRIAGKGDTIAVTVDGARVELPRGASLLAALLAYGAPGAAADFHCAIGQCQRCLVRVGAEVRVACLFIPKGGERVDTRPSDGRALPWSAGDTQP
jgi:aerobic-type carbon monoxide dehydrogenase small subunit (CoxS/CutS family)